MMSTRGIGQGTPFETVRGPCPAGRLPSATESRNRAPVQCPTRDRRARTHVCTAVDRARYWNPQPWRPERGEGGVNPPLPGAPPRDLRPDRSERCQTPRSVHRSSVSFTQTARAPSPPHEPVSPLLGEE